MKLLRLSFDHLCMFEDGNFQIDFYAQDKVFLGDESVTLIEKPVYSSNVVAIAGINASGKSAALSLIDLGLRVVEGRPIGLKGYDRGLSDAFSRETNMSALLWHDGGLYLLRSCIAVAGEYLHADTMASELSFGEEVLYRIGTKPITKAMMSKTDDELAALGTEVMRRSTIDAKEKRFLQKDVGILAGYADGTETHLLFDASDFPLTLQQGFEGLDAVLRTFDSSIEHLDVEDGGRAYWLKFATSEEPMTLSRKGLEDVLSSGTVKGLIVVQNAVMVLRLGGYLMLDEIENHLNRQLVNVIIDLFASDATNPHGATLVFTTHYPEVLDHVHRKDNVYFLARGAGLRSSVVKYSAKVKRVENKKSEVFVSNFVGGTAPKYSDVKALRDFVEAAVGGSHGE